MHLALYALMFAMRVSGIAMSQAGDHPVHILGITLPTMVGRDEALRAASQRAHHLMAWAIGILLAAALRHRLVAKDAMAQRTVGHQKGRSFHCSRLQAKTAFSRFPRIHRADPERQRRVGINPFAAPSGNDRCLRIPAVHCSVFELITPPRASARRPRSDRL